MKKHIILVRLIKNITADFPIVIPKKGGTIGGTIGGIMDLTDRQREILALIARDNQLTVTALSSLLKINRSAAQAHIDALKTKGVLKRIGGTRGYWQVITNNLSLI